MFDWLWKIVPTKYSWAVAIKKIAYTVAKFAVAGLVSIKVTSESDVTALTETVGLVLVGLLEFAHDWLRMKFPNAKWL